MGLLFLLTLAFGAFLMYYEKLNASVREKDKKEAEERWGRVKEFAERNERRNQERQG